MALTNTLRAPLGVGLPSSPRVRRFWGHFSRGRQSGPNLAVSVSSDEPFEAQIPLAAAAERLVEEDADGVTWWLHMPGGGRDNTEVVWDPKRSKLSMGVWSTNVARREGRNSSPRRLLWHASTWLPGADGSRATASIVRGWVGVRLPHLKPA
jgi:hypothetical protein